MLRSIAVLFNVNQNPTPSIDRWNSHAREDRKPWGIIIALLVAVALHLLLFIILREIEFFQKLSTAEVETEQMNVDQVILEDVPEVIPEADQTVPDLTESQETFTELDDILPELLNQDIDIRAEIKDPELSIKMSTPAKLGDLNGVLDDVLLSESNITPLEEIGTGMMNNTIAADGQIILEEGSIKGELIDPNDILDDSALKGAGGLALDGVMEGYSSLDELMSMSTVNLQGARTALPSDMLFEYDSAELKSAARFGLMKLIMLISRNPQMYCILEGHTDTYGEDYYNNKLSKERAESVKNYLLKYLDPGSGSKIIVRGYGKSRPLIAEGTQEEQAPNRRVDILMRKNIPAKGKPFSPKPTVKKEVILPPEIITPEEPKPAVIAPAENTIKKPIVVSPPEEPVSAILVEEEAPEPEPVRAIIVEDEEPEPVRRRAILVKPRRIPIGADNAPRRAIIIEEEPVRAIIVED